MLYENIIVSWFLEEKRISVLANRHKECTMMPRNNRPKNNNLIKTVIPSPDSAL